MKEFTRRELLKTAGVAAAAVVASKLSQKISFSQQNDRLKFRPERTIYPPDGFIEPENLDRVWRIERDESESLSFFEASQIARRFDKIRDKLPEIDIPASEESALAILVEYNNFFKEQGIVKNIFYPESIEFKLLSAGRHSGVLGSTNCDERITFNIRQINPVSPWYNRDDWLWTVVHESAHIQQGVEVCRENSGTLGPATLLEATAELMTAEVMASCANKRDENAFISLVDAIRGWAIGAALSDAIKRGHPEWYKDLSQELTPGAMNKSAVEALFRKYQTGMKQLGDILEAYNATPLKIAMDAIDNSHGLAQDLALPKVRDWGYGTTNEYVPSLVLDDFKYFISHAEEMAADLFKK